MVKLGVCHSDWKNALEQNVPSACDTLPDQIKNDQWKQNYYGLVEDMATFYKLNIGVVIIDLFLACNLGALLVSVMGQLAA